MAGDPEVTGGQSSVAHRRLLVLLLVIAPVTMTLSIFGGSKEVCVSAASCALFFVLANTETTLAAQSAIAETLFARALRKLRFPSQFTTSKNDEFSGLSICFAIAMLSGMVGILSPQASAAPGEMLRAIVDRSSSVLSSPRYRDQGNKETDNSPQAGTESHSPSATLPCDDTKTSQALSAKGVGVATQNAILQAQHQYGPPSVGCVVSKIGFLDGGRAYVILDGGESDELVIGDSRMAAASINAGAQALIQRILDPTQVPLIAKTLASLRAGTGVFQMVEMSDHSCRVLLSPDGAEQAFLLTPYQTAAVAKRGEALVAFPMATTSSAEHGTVVEYIAVDTTSQNGYRRLERQVVPFDAERQGDADPGLRGCADLNSHFAALADPLEQAANAAARR